jgi:hypothetical protein
VQRARRLQQARRRQRLITGGRPGRISGVRPSSPICCSYAGETRRKHERSQAHRRASAALSRSPAWGRGRGRCRVGARPWPAHVISREPLGTHVVCAVAAPWRATSRVGRWGSAGRDARAGCFCQSAPHAAAVSGRLAAVWLCGRSLACRRDGPGADPGIDDI